MSLCLVALRTQTLITVQTMNSGSFSSLAQGPKLLCLDQKVKSSFSASWNWANLPLTFFVPRLYASSCEKEIMCLDDKVCLLIVLNMKYYDRSKQKSHLYRWRQSFIFFRPVHFPTILGQSEIHRYIIIKAVHATSLRFSDNFLWCFLQICFCFFLS